MSRAPDPAAPLGAPAAPPAYRPVALDRVGIARPVTPAQRTLPQAVLLERHARNVAEEARWARFAPRVKRRMGMHVLGTVPCMLFVNWLLTPLGLQALYVQVPVYALLGAALGFLRPNRDACSGLFVAAGGACLLLAGIRPCGVPLLMTLIVWALMGTLAGVGIQSQMDLDP